MASSDEESFEVFDPDLAAVQFVQKRRADWATSMQTKRKICARLDKRYFNYRRDLAYADDTAGGSPRANIGVPLAAETVDTAYARSHDVLLGSRPYGRITGAEGDADDYKAQIQQAVVNIQQAKPWFPRNTGRIIKDAIKYGLGVGKMHFKRETRKVPEPIMLFGVRIGSQMVEKSIMQTPYLEHVHIQDVFFPLDAPSFAEAEGVIHRTWQDMGTMLKAKDGLGFPLYDPEALQMARNFMATRDEDENLQVEETTRKIQKGGLHKAGKHALIEYTGKLPRNLAQSLMQRYPQADEHGDWIITIVEGVMKPLRAEPDPHPERMWIGAKIIDDPGYIWGIALVEAVEALGLTIDELYNMALDNMNFVINKMFYYNRLAGIDESDMVASPGKKISGSRPFNEAMAVIEWPDIAQSVFLLIQNFLSHYKEYTGIQNPILGRSASGSQTATEFQGLEQNSATRLGQFDLTLEDTLMRPMFEMWTVLNQRFLDQEFVNRMLKNTQPEFPRVAPEDLSGVFDYYFEGAAKAQSDALAIGQYLQALQINATQPVPIFDPLFIAKKLAERWRWPNPIEAINPEFQEQFAFYTQINALKAAGETAQALTPEQAKQDRAGGNGSNPAKQGAAAQPENTGIKDFRSALATVKETALPQGLSEGQV